MGDDEQADEIRAYQHGIEDRPADERIRYRENDDDGRTEPARASTDPGAGSDTGM